jgi:glycosyltransferase involved in cell wall biosynthesis
MSTKADMLVPGEQHPVLDASPVATSPRVAVICDYREEQWFSMDLVADMLFQHLQRDHMQDFSVQRLCPPLRTRFGRLPILKPTFRNVDRLWNRFADYPRWLQNRADQFDLFHIVDHSYSQLVHYLPPRSTVVTCHDLDTFRCLLAPEKEPRPRWFRAMTARILSGFKKAAHIVAVSAATRDEILRHGLIPQDRVTVVALGVHPSCSPCPDPVADAELQKLLPSEFRTAACLLNVGSTMPRKRLDVLLKVFAAVHQQRPDVRLLRVGDRLTAVQRELVRELGVEDSVLEIPAVTREVLAAAYRRAQVLVHTSEAEGFGLPLIEAMACGCRVIASDLPVLREVGGGAATYCPVGQVESWQEAVLRILEEGSEPQLRQDALDRVIEHAALFSWAKNADQTIKIYQQLLDEERRPQ